MGSKRRIAKEILPIILKNRKEGQTFVEPFAGGMNITNLVANPRIANDISTPVIEFFKALTSGWEPPKVCTEDEYHHMKRNKELYPAHLLGFIGIVCAFGGDYFQGYARCKQSRNYCLEGYNKAIRQRPLLEGVQFENVSYLELQIPPNSIIYCDPPYQGVHGYNVIFNHEEFWEWVRTKTKEGHEVFVSEYNAPDDFDCLWSKEVLVNLTNLPGQLSLKPTEKLFKLRCEHEVYEHGHCLDCGEWSEK